MCKSGSAGLWSSLINALTWFLKLQATLYISTTSSLLDRQIMVIQTWEFGRHFSQKWSQSVTSRKTTESILSPIIKFEFSSTNQNLGKLVSSTVNLRTFQFSYVFLMSSIILIIYVIVILLYELSQCSDDLSSSWTSTFQMVSIRDTKSCICERPIQSKS